MGLTKYLKRKIKNNTNLFGFIPALLINSQKRFYTKSGFLMTLVISIFSILITLYFSSDLIYHFNPKIQISTHNNNFFPNKKIFTDTNNPFFITILDRKLQPMMNAKNIYEFYIHQEIMDISSPTKNIRKTYKMIECQESHFKGKNLNHMKALFYIKKNLYCLPFNFSAEIEGQYTTAVTKMIEISMESCTKETNINCIHENKRNKTDDQGVIILGFYDYDIDPNSYKNYAIPILNTIPLPFNNEIINGIHVEFKTNVIETDSNLFWQSKKKEEIVNLDKYEISSTNFNFYDKNKTQKIIFYMMHSMKKIVYTRSYKKIPDILGQIGGILNIFIFIGNFISIPFTEISFYLYIIKKINKNFSKKINSIENNKNNAFECK